ncbi:MAG: hypothetical protein H0X29_08030 [Parachlamydiaceae bacterium]|nr:hypothetical protein [Parachlamydiaceae bacterium]
MKLFNQKKSTFFLKLFAAAFLALSASPLLASITDNAKSDLNSYFEKAPWLGLITDEITYGPVKISHVHLHDGDKVVFAAPGDELHGSLKYRIKSDDLATFHLNHLVIGIKGEGPQDCLTHNVGVWDSHGKTRFKLKAPEKAGIYEVRFLLTEGLTCSNARDTWEFGEKVPGSNATIGVIIVE